MNLRPSSSPATRLAATALTLSVSALSLLPHAATAQADEPAPSPSPAGTVAPSSLIVDASALPLVAPSPDPAAESESIEALPEPDFLVGDWELQRVPWRSLRLNGTQPIPVETEGPQDTRGVPMRALGPGGRLVYNPTVLAQQGMKRLDAYVQTNDRAHLRQARKYADVLDSLATDGLKRRWQPHDYDMGVHESGWVNANSHGLVLSFLSRLYQLNGGADRLVAADLLTEAFKQREGANKRWISTVTAAGYVWFEHWPDGRFDHTLNAHLNAMFGLYDYWRATGSPLAEQYFLGGAKTVRDKLFRFRRKGDLSRYSLEVADGSLHYHETHIDQLRLLSRMTGDDWFAKQAGFFERDERAWRTDNRGGGQGR